MKTDELREKYLEFFQSKGHSRQPSDVLVPTWDPSVLFTPAGMNQFKDHFLGKIKLDFNRAATCQKCLRTGDIDNVGRTAYHHTFFEMLGNFSFGDYFKRDAIHWAWEFLTDKKWLAMAPERLTVTVYHDDDEAAGIWSDELGLPNARIERLDEDENFWPASAPSQGPDGVCGPCSEIFYHPDNGKSVEIWNLVFTQFNRVGDPPDNLRSLPSKNIDTGMGLERAAAVLQGVESNFGIDSLASIVRAAADVCSVQYEYGTEEGRRVRRITDHVRACTFSIHENVYPGPNKEKYVIRRLLRRAVLDGHQLGMHEPFLYKLVAKIAEVMAGPYPELTTTVDRVADVIRREETSFFGTIDAGLARIENIFNEMRKENRPVVDGAEVAELYQTQGVPPELFESMAAEHNLTFDWDGFRRAMAKHGELSGPQQFVVFKTGPIEALKKALHLTEFIGYDATESAAEIKGIVAQNQLCDTIEEVGHEDPIVVVLDRSPFYGESGGQVGDRGEIVGKGFRFEVTDTQKDGELILHFGHLREGVLQAGGEVAARVDADYRQAVRRAHSATHILHHALQETLGSHAQQQGSKVEPDWLRFDFTNPRAVSSDELAAIEGAANERIAGNATVNAAILPLAEARAAGAMMLFGEKYPDPVRMVSMGQFSKELCGGTHLATTDEVGRLEIVAEEGIAAGIRRITALTGPGASEFLAKTGDTLRRAAEILSVSPDAVPPTTKRLLQRVRDLKKHLAAGTPTEEPLPAATVEAAAETPQTDARAKAALREAARALNVGLFDVPGRLESLSREAKDLEGQLDRRERAGVVDAEALLAAAEQVDGVTVVVAEAAALGPNLMRQLIDQIRQKSAPCAVLLVTVVGDDKVQLVAGVSRDLLGRGLHAGNWVREVAQIVGGGGGGKAEMAQAGGREPDKIPQALQAASEHVRRQLAP